MIQLDGNITIESNHDQNEDNYPISVHISYNRPDLPSYKSNLRKCKKDNLITVKRSNKLLEASQLPVVVNLNPRSLYNKQNEFRTMVEQTEAGICAISETWDRSNIDGGTLISDLLDIEGYRWVKNIVQRRRKGGKPAILISEKDYYIKELCPEVITVPVDVEVAWALLTPKYRSPQSRIKHIAVASVYYSSSQTRKDDFLDHISESYNILCAKYGSDLKFLIIGDINRLNIKPILNLSPDLHQAVKVITRHNPDATLDVIITNIQSLYQPPTTLPPLDNDENESGKPSDHLIVVMRPLSSEFSSVPKKYKTIKYRPFPDSGIREMGQWIQAQSWHDIYSIKCPNQKASRFEEVWMEKFPYFPMKKL